MNLTDQDAEVVQKISGYARETDIQVTGGRIRRTSSRFCLGVEHGDYHGTELFGVGTDRFIWLAYKVNDSRHVRLFSGNFPEDGIIEFNLSEVPPPQSNEISHTWARFPWGVDYILRREGISLTKGIDAIIYGNIPGGGMSRSASLTLNIILSLLDANDIDLKDSFQIVAMAQAVENDYIGSPCGQLDQVMILLARENMGTYYQPQTKTINYVPLGAKAIDFSLVIMDTGTVRAGLEKSTYKIRRAECEELVKLARKVGYDITCLADVKEQALYKNILTHFQESHPHHCDRLKYIFSAQQRFYRMLEAWKKGDIETVGELFRADGLSLRDDYKISGEELEKMCDIARTVPGVLGERMLGGGDKGASGALVRSDRVEALKQAIESEYPRCFPEYRDKFSVNVCKMVEGVRVLDGCLK